MLRLGHISYSNCIPVHGRFLEEGPPRSVTLVHGVPADLNRELAAGTVDVAPASSIEFARHADRYRLLPDLSISAPAAVRTIQLFSWGGLQELRDGARVALPTASSTSVALLKIILNQRLGIRPVYEWYDQESGDPLAAGFAAALCIGDVANRRLSRRDVCNDDLAAIWREWTGRPFVFALWQTGAWPEKQSELRRLAEEIRASRDWSLERLPRLAETYADEYGWSSTELVAYWRSLSYSWDESLAGGLAEFYRRAAEIGEIEASPSPSFLEP